MGSNKIGKTINESEKIWTRDFVLICFANFFIFLCFQMTLPTLPLFVKELGGSDQLIGMIVGIFTFSALAFRPYAGHALESKGRRFVYMLGLGILDRKSTRLNSSHVAISYAVFCLKKKTKEDVE